MSLDEYNENFLEDPFTIKEEDIQVLILMNLIEIQKKLSSMDLDFNLKSGLGEIRCEVANQMRTLHGEIEHHLRLLR
jgi:hypothetical protein